MHQTGPPPQQGKAFGRGGQCVAGIIEDANGRGLAPQNFKRLLTVSDRSYTRNPAAFTTSIINPLASGAVCTVVCWHDSEIELSILPAFPLSTSSCAGTRERATLSLRAEVTHSVWVAEYPNDSNLQGHPLLGDTSPLRDISDHFAANMPPSARRTQRARRDTRKEATTSSDAVADSSPTRPAKRRKKVGLLALNSWLQSMMNAR